MALPLLTSIDQCASYARTVEPFLGQLRQLPAAAADAVAAAVASRSGDSLLALYVDTNPLVFGFAVSVALGAVFFVAAEVNRNYSQVDRAWSLLPTAYIAHFGLWARLVGLPSRRLDLALLCSLIWSIRLTYNYARKGGYNVGSQDYRWMIVKDAIPGWLFFLLDLTFISFFQSILLFAIAAPAYILLLTGAAVDNTTTGLTPIDGLFAAALLGLVAVEWFADQQQWAYQAAKAQYQKTARVPAGCGFSPAALDRGFVAEGLWAYSRHPNFAAEQSVWLVLYQWSCVASGGSTLYSWAGTGAAVLVLLFQCSTALTERITGGKYPDYADYQRQVGMFVPTGLAGYRRPRSGLTTSSTGPRRTAASKSTSSSSSSRSSSGPRVIRTSELAKRQAEKEAREAASTGRGSRESARKR